MKINWSKLVVSLLLPFLAGVIGSIFTVSSVNSWYAGLNKPVFNPPSWIFSPVWTLLYLLMGIALYLVWQKLGELNQGYGLIWLFITHLAVNALWSVVFFGWQSPGWAFLVIITLWLFILILIINFWKVKKTAAWLMLPYLIWVSFAVVLNYFIWQLN